MRAHWRYACYVARHKWFVFLAGRRTGAPLWRLLIHDWSKMTPQEWTPYVAFFYGSEPTGAPRDQHDRPNRDANRQDEIARRKAAFDRAWLHHQKWNRHHWQAWVLREDSGETIALEMPDRYIAEMVADWMGAGRAITGRWETREWYKANAHKMLLHETTRWKVEALLAHAFFGVGLESPA